MSAVDGWKKVVLGSILVPKNDKSKQVNSSEYLTTGSFPVIDQSSEFICGYHEDDSRVIDTGLPYTVFGDHTRHTKFVDFPFIAGADGTQLIKPIQGIDDKFFYYLVSDAAKNIGNYGYDRHFKHLKIFECQYPTDEQEQTQIATILSTLDRTIEQTEAIIAKQQRIKAGLMQDLLTKGIDEHGDIRSEANHQFKDSPLGRIPVEWELKNLDSCVRQDSPICYGILMPGSGFDNGVPVIKVKDIFDGNICEKDILLTDPKIDQAYKRSRLIEGDLLMTIRGTTGRLAIVPQSLDGANITQDTARIRLKPEHSNFFFYFLLHSRGVQDQVLLHTLGQAVKGINIAEVRRLSFALPEKPEQERISAMLLQANNLWENAMDCRTKLQKQKSGLMNDLLTGTVRVN